MCYRLYTVNVIYCISNTINCCSTVAGVWEVKSLGIIVYKLAIYNIGGEKVKPIIIHSHAPIYNIINTCTRTTQQSHTSCNFPHVPGEITRKSNDKLYISILLTVTNVLTGVFRVNLIGSFFTTLCIFHEKV